MICPTCEGYGSIQIHGHEITCPTCLGEGAESEEDADYRTLCASVPAEEEE